MANFYEFHFFKSLARARARFLNRKVFPSSALLSGVKALFALISEANHYSGVLISALLAGPAEKKTQQMISQSNQDTKLKEKPKKRDFTNLQINLLHARLLVSDCNQESF